MTNDDDSGRGIDDTPSESGPEPPPISQRVLDLYRKARRAKTREERANVMLAMAEAFTKEHDFTDFEATDDWHAYIEDFESVRLQYERSALRLARLLLNTLDEYYDGEEPEATLASSSKLIN